MGTYSGAHLNGISLTNPSQNPVTIDSTGYIGDNGQGEAIIGASTLSFNVYNFGRIETTQTFANHEKANSHAGIWLLGGGAVYNGASGIIDVTGIGVRLSGTVGAVTNLGTISASNPLGEFYSLGYGQGIGVELRGLLVNGAVGQQTALISGNGNGATISYGTVKNYGRIIGLPNESQPGYYGASGARTSGRAVSANNTLIINYQGGIMQGRLEGVVDTSGIVINDGMIAASNFNGTAGKGIVFGNGGVAINAGTISAAAYGVVSYNSIYGASGGTVVNTGLIEATGAGAVGIRLDVGGATVVNSGTIASGGQYAVEFNDNVTGRDRVVIDPGAVFQGALKTKAATDTIELAGGIGQGGTLHQFGSQYVGFTQIQVDSGTTWTINAAAPTSLQGVTLTANGNLVMPGAAYYGDFVASGGGTVDFSAGVFSAATAGFSGAGGTIEIDQLDSRFGGQQIFNGTIAGMVDGDRLHIATSGLGSFTTIDSATPGAFSSGNNTTPLYLRSGGSLVATLTLQGNYSGDAFGINLPTGGFVDIGMQMNRASDFNGDATGDVLFRYAANGPFGQYGQLQFAVMKNGQLSPTANPDGLGFATAGLGTLTTGGHGDVNGDGISDVVVQDPNSGRMYGGEQDGTGSAIPQWVLLGPPVPGFGIVGVGDVQGNGRADIVIQSAGGEIDYYDTRDDTFAPVGVTPGWRVVGVGDVNGDGYADVVIQSQDANRQIAYASMAGGAFDGNWTNVGFTPGWDVKAVADLTGDGFADIVVQSETGTNPVAYADMHGGQFSGNWGVATTPIPADFAVSDTADVLNNGHADLIVQQQSTGVTYYAQEGASGFLQWGLVDNNLNSNFHVV